MRIEQEPRKPPSNQGLDESRASSSAVIDKLAGRPFDVENAAVHGRDLSSLVTEVHQYQRGEELPQHLVSRLLPACKDAHVLGPLYMADGSNVLAGENLRIYPQVDLGDNLLISLGNNVTIGSRVSISNIIHPLDAVQRVSNIVKCKPVSIGDNVTIGSGTVIVPGVTIGNNVAIEKNSVVTKDIPSNVVVGGKPVRVYSVDPDTLKASSDSDPFFGLYAEGPTFKASQRTGLLLKLINSYDLENESIEAAFRVLLGDDNFGKALICRPFYCEDGRNLRIDGPFTLINNGCILRDGDPEAPISIGRGTFLGPRVDVRGGAEIKEFCWLGANSTIGNRAVIGAGSVIAAGAIIPEDVVIPPGSLVMGDHGEVKRQIGVSTDSFELHGLLNTLVFNRSVERRLYRPGQQ